MEDGAAVLWGLSWEEWQAFAEILRNFALIGGVIGAAVALYFTYQRTSNDRRRLANDTYVKAVEQLGSAEMNVRLGAIYALERIAIEEARYHWPIMETLSAYVRERAPWPPKDDGAQAITEALREAFRPESVADASGAEEEKAEDARAEANGSKRAPTDIQTVLTVIGRRPRKRREIRPLLWPVRYWARQRMDALERRIGRDDAERWQRFGWHIVRAPIALLAAKARPRESATIDLRHADLRHTDIRNGAFARAQFNHSSLAGADLNGAHLEGADLSTAHLEGANPREAHLEGADLSGAHLERADLSGAHLKGADLSRANLKGADLAGAHLERAELNRAHLEEAFLMGAHLERADLSWARLKGTDLMGAYLEGAKFSKEPKELGAVWNDDDPPTGVYVVG